MWDIILNPFITVLTLLYQLFNSSVIAIILFTVLIRLITFPLTAQQTRASKAMAELQPELKKIQDKYKNDREKLSQEQMRLYRENGINPLGGCLPLIIQLPIWIGLYQAINHALAATPLQLLDLSGRFLITGLDRLVPLNNVFLGMDLTQSPSANPTYALVFPVLVLITSYVQSKMMTPPAAPADPDGRPNQAAAMTQSMTTIMPLMMGMFSLSFSVGLSVYFIVSNIMGIVQYAMGNKDKKFDWRTLLPFSPSPRGAAKPVVVPVGPGGKSTLKAKLEAERAVGLNSGTTITDETASETKADAKTNGKQGDSKVKSPKAKPAK
ncbi:MAG: YidC/Oxa1 family membrane protein insertase [Chloroflexi bacterium]|nr:YidC/Oxa1 family membrane protein insertase [Chloroflexota bacterium]MCC6895602.1 YidC/Oxa1 family membrane protein insertase [Anaerolineae bacterium]